MAPLTMPEAKGEKSEDIHVALTMGIQTFLKLFFKSSYKTPGSGIQATITVIVHLHHAWSSKMKITSVFMATLIVLFPVTYVSASEPAQIMLIGTFHFSNPGKDVVKVKDINIFDGESQLYLQAFSQSLAAFSPTRVLLEYNPENEELINQRYRDYLAGKYELGANEIYQLGFRIAKAAGLKSVQSFDHRELNWEAEPMMEYAKQHDSPEMVVFNEKIAYLTSEEDKARASMGLRELLIRSNDPERDRLNMDLYLATNSIGAGDGYSGADATASWWQRNFRMYANIQQVAKPGDRIIAIGGSGHMAILKQLLEIDERMVKVEVDGYF